MAEVGGRLAPGMPDGGLELHWAGRDRFVILDAGPHPLTRFIDIGSTWRSDPARSAVLHVIAVVAQMPDGTDLARQLTGAPAGLAAEILAHWPAATPDIHRLEFDHGRLRLMVVAGEVGNALRELVAQVDFFLVEDLRTGGRIAKALARLAAPGAGVAARAISPALHDELRAAGFMPVDNGGSDGGTFARYQPRFSLRRPAGRQPVVDPAARREAIVIGAGLAGCAVVDALASTGWRCTLIDRHAQPASEASGNPAGVFHGVVHASDGPHARFNRAAALEATRAYRALLRGLADPASLGHAEGLLRLGAALPDARAMHHLLHQLGLPPDHVQALDAAAAGCLAGLAIDQPAWFYPGGGWMRPARLARAWLQRAAERVRRLDGIAAARIERSQSGCWQVFDDAGACIANAPLLVLANADGVKPLLEQLAAQRGATGAAAGAPALPLERVRGQLTTLVYHAAQPAPRLALSGAGYLLPPLDGQLIFGATAQPGDPDPELRGVDQLQNLQRLARLSPALDGLAASAPAQPLAGRTAWRCVTADRLPLVGAVPLPWTGGRGAGDHGSADQPRRVEREPGLLMLTGLGSRGLTWAPLAAQVIAALADGAPVPLPAALIDAIDPARFVSRTARRATRAGGGCDGSD